MGRLGLFFRSTAHYHVMPSCSWLLHVMTTSCLSQELQEKLDKAKQRREKKAKEKSLEQDAGRKRKRASGIGASVLEVGVDAVYQPKTKETRAAYEALLGFIQQQFGDQPQDILRGAADEVLAVMNNDELKAPAKQKEVEGLLNAMPEAKYTQLAAICRLITDFGQDSKAVATGEDGEGALDDDIGVAVEFDEDSEEEESDLDEVQVRSQDTLVVRA